jgi:hypothetical protein
VKRSPLRRNTPLKSGKPLAQGSPLARTGKLKKTRARAHGTAEERMNFKLSTLEENCVLCGKWEGQAWIETGRGHEAHHAISQQALKRRGLHAHLWDPRNAVALCSEPCHRRVTSRKRPLFWHELPDAAKDFADALGLLGYLERRYPQ